MAPSRGFTFLFRLQNVGFCSTRQFSSFVERATSPKIKTQIYISRSLNPYLNLSIEHYLLQRTPEDSTILFLYTNGPSVIIGRNQNPWTEVGLAALKAKGFDLVRRRSGGGTVLHDEGNVNYSVICPTKIFDRDKHAEMVVRALKGLGVDKAKVNCRHDIVVDKFDEEKKDWKTFKVSGSAYKLTRLRSLHHGTCLLNSPNLGAAKQLLTAPGKQWFKARGVESVRSPIMNVGLANKDFEEAVVKEFKAIYDREAEARIVGDEEGNIPEVATGFEELKSESWIYEQTPQFTFTTEIPNRRETLEGTWLPENFSASFTIRHGMVTECKINDTIPYSRSHGVDENDTPEAFLLRTPIHKIAAWDEQVFPQYIEGLSGNISYNTRSSKGQNDNTYDPGMAFNHIFGQTNGTLDFAALDATKKR